MSYVNLETEQTDFRLILSEHGDITKAQQLPDNCTGVLIEAGFIDSKDFFDDIESGSFLLDKQYDEIIAVAEDKQLPIVTAEPLYTQKKLDDYNNRVVDSFTLLCHLPLLPGFLYLARSSKEINMGNLAFRLLYQSALFLEDVTSTKEDTQFRNLVMAQRAESFASLQISEGIKRPCLALIVGGLHLGVIRALEASEEGRVRRIMESPFLEKYVRMESLPEGYISQYNKGRKRWGRYSFEDPRLKVF